MPTLNIKIPIKILTEKIPCKQNSIFYAGRNIAEIKIINRTYVLTTSGEYRFQLKGNGKAFLIDSDGKTNGRKPSVINKLTDAKILTMNRDDLIGGWGWFGINVWDKDKYNRDVFLDYPTDAYSEYHEAMSAFIEFVENDIKNIP